MSAITSIKYEKQGDVQRFMLDLPNQADVVLDFAGVPEDARGGTAKKMLAASAMSCYCGTLSSALTARGAPFTRISGSAHVETGLDAQSRARVQKIVLDVEVELDEDYEDVFERCIKIMKQGCLVTASLEAAFPVEYNVKQVFEE